MKRTILSWLTAAFFLCNHTHAEENCDASLLNFCNTSFQVGYAFGQYIALEDNYTQFGLFSPLLNRNDFQFLVDLKGYRLDNGKWGASSGFGLRTLSLCDSVFGFNMYYDYIRGESKHNYNQVGAGLEWLNSCYEIRVNGYLPFGIKTYSCCKCCFDDYGDGLFARRQFLNFAYGGFDAEAGITVFRCRDIRFYSAVGPYYYQRNRARDFFGGFVRFQADWRDIFTAQLIITTDKQNHTKAQGIITFSIPLRVFGCEPLCSCNDLLLQPIRRNGIILTDSCCDWEWNWNDD